MSPRTNTSPTEPDRDKTGRQRLECDAAQGRRLLAGILDGVVHDFSEVLAVALTMRDPATEHPHRLHSLADWGCGVLLTALQTGGPTGPLRDAAVRPVVSPNLWDDPRWPHLTLAAAWTHHPEQFGRLRPIRGVAALHVITEESDREIVLSVALRTPADDTTLKTLRRHESLVASAIDVTQKSLYNSRNAEEVFSMVQSRATIEQAKGIIMSLRGCSAEQAWGVLRDSSSQLNVKVRNLATALVDHLAGASIDQSGDRLISPGRRDRQAAEVLWRVLHDCHRPDGLATIRLLPIPGGEPKRLNGSKPTASGVQGAQPTG